MENEVVAAVASGRLGRDVLAERAAQALADACQALVVLLGLLFLLCSLAVLRTAAMTTIPTPKKKC